MNCVPVAFPRCIFLLVFEACPHHFLCSSSLLTFSRRTSHSPLPPVSPHPPISLSTVHPAVPLTDQRGRGQERRPHLQHQQHRARHLTPNPTVPSTAYPTHINITPQPATHNPSPFGPTRAIATATATATATVPLSSSLPVSDRQIPPPTPTTPPQAPVRPPNTIFLLFCVLSSVPSAIPVTCQCATLYARCVLHAAWSDSDSSGGREGDRDRSK